MYGRLEYIYYSIVKGDQFRKEIKVQYREYSTAQRVQCSIRSTVN